jgi:hypothetical protein
MASFSRFLGREVTVQYRVGDILLPATGIFSADSGRSIFLEQHVEQRGKLSYFRWEVPYQYIHRIEETANSSQAHESVAEFPGTDSAAASDQPTARAAHAASGNPSILSPAQPPKTA